MIRRSIQPYLLKLAKMYPVVSVTGPRQSGKTTLIKNTFPNHEYLNLEDDRIRTIAKSDPIEFLKSFDKPIIIDEAQYVPEIFSAVQVISDEAETCGWFILSGSQNFLLLQNITQSLAGRVGILKLLPLSFSEIYEFDNNIENKKFMIEGSYPRIYNSHIPQKQFYQDYILTYINRDVKNLLVVRNVHDFDRLIKLLALNSGQLLNYSSISKNLGVDIKTVKSWMSILVSSYICYLLPPYYANLKKRLVKSSKIYFTDTGLLCYLLNINNTKQYEQSEFKGHIFENFIMEQHLKKYFGMNENPTLSFYRDNDKNEVDLIDETGLNDYKMIEIKSSSLYSKEHKKTLLKISNLLNTPIDKCCVINNGAMSFKDEGLKVFSFQDWATSKLPKSNNKK